MMQELRINPAFPMGGYLKKILRVDLTARRISTEVPGAEILYQYIGGTGLAMRLLYDEMKPMLDPLDPESRIIFATGPLTGTRVPGSGTYTVASKNTLTSGTAFAQANGFFGARLKSAGYDAVIVQGRSKTPVYLHIDDGHASVEDAAQLWGRDAFQTERLLRQRYGEGDLSSRISVASIGPAGENCVRFASISSDRGHTVASGGLGAVMGSKNLKAVVVHGRQKIPLSPRGMDQFLKLTAKWRKEAGQSAMGQLIDTQGTLGFFSPYHAKGWIPVKNLTTNRLAEADVFAAERLRNEFFEMKPRSCHACTLHHCHTVSIRKGAYKGFVGEEPEYEIMAGFGPNWGIGDPGAVTMLNDFNDRLGMDGKEVSFLVSMLMEGYAKGLIGSGDLDGLTLEWGNVESVKQLMRKISRREGVGDVLAEGVMRAADKLGGEFPRMAVFVKRGNAPHIHDPRTRWGTLFTQAVSNMGSQEGMDMTARANAELGFDRPTSEPDEYVGRVQAITGPKRQFEECLVFCYFQACSLKTMVQTLNSVVGADYSVDECLTVGRRVINLMRMFNARAGMTAADDSISPRLQQAPVDGPGKGKSLAPTFDQVKQIYYREMGWDENGIPSRDTLEELGLGFAIVQ